MLIESHARDSIINPTKSLIANYLLASIGNVPSKTSQPTGSRAYLTSTKLDVYGRVQTIKHMLPVRLYANGPHLATVGAGKNEAIAGRATRLLRNIVPGAKGKVVNLD